MISILDIDIGNVGSVRNMLKSLGYESRLICQPEQIAQADKIILPGIGAFDRAIHRLEKDGCKQALVERVELGGVPMLGICLGMHILGHSSEEGQANGLGLIDAQCQRFVTPLPEGRRVPHMGWNLVDITQDTPLFKGLSERNRFYFTHSYHMVSAHTEHILATTPYGISFTSAVHCENVYGVQFHPEKSHKYGKQLLQNFAELI